MNKQIDISIIIPVFKVEPYLSQCLNSILAQTIDNIEIICSYTESPDYSLGILKEYAKKDKRIHIVYRDDGGLGGARNYGLTFASGKYVLFIDSDDWIAHDACEKLFHIAETENADMVICAIQNYDDSTGQLPEEHWCHELPFPKELELKSFTHKDINPTDVVSENAPVSAWNKLYKRSFIEINKLRFPENLRYEDNPFYYKAFILAERICFTNERFYFYRINRKGSLQQSSSDDKSLFDIVPIMKLIWDVFNINNSQPLIDAFNKYMISEFAWRCIYMNFNKRLFLKIINETFPQQETKCLMENLKEELIKREMPVSLLEKDLLTMCMIAVIIPTYNNELTIKTCIDSVLCQSLGNIEIFVVNDCSTDKTAKILKSMKKQDERITVINLEHNRGPGYSRAHALKLINSEFVFFLDGDDLLASPYVLEILYDVCKRHNIHTAAGNMLCFYENNESTIYNGHYFNESCKMEYSQYVTHPTWGFTRFLFNYDLIILHNIEFPTTRYYEDPLFLTRYMSVAREFWAIPQDVYLYRSSTEAKPLTIQQYLDLFTNINEVLQNLKNISFELYYYEYRTFLNFTRNALDYLEDYTKHKPEIHNLVDIVFSSIDFSYCEGFLHKDEIYHNLSEFLGTEDTCPIVNESQESIRVQPLKRFLKSVLRPAFNLYRRAVQKAINPMLNEVCASINHELYTAIQNAQTELLHSIEETQLNAINPMLNDACASLNHELSTAIKNAQTELSNSIKETQLNALKDILKTQAELSVLMREMQEILASIAEKSSANTASLIEQSNANTASLVEQSKCHIENRIWHSEEFLIKKIRSDTFFTSHLLKKQFSTGVDANSKHSAVYTSVFYDDNRYASLQSGYEVLKYILCDFEINSIVDFGCGSGTWLYAAMALGVKDVIGVDGDYVDRSILLIDNNNFIPYNLEKSINLNRSFGLAISMEVAEHLCESSSNIFVDTLCTHSDKVLFSAAHPGQGGDNHINEQPFEYWSEKFIKRGYNYVNIRDEFTNNLKVEPWYRENMGLFIKND